VVAAVGDDHDGPSSGAAYVFTRSGIVWSQQAKLLDPDGAAYDYFGISVVVDDDTVVVGAFGDDDAGSASGSAYVFTRFDGVWSQQEKLTAPDGAIGDEFGVSVALAGDTAVVGAYGDDDQGSASGSASVFLLDNTPPTIAATVSPVPNEAGWNNTLPVTVTFECSDSASGIASCTPPVTLTSETPGQVVSGTAADNAGNVAAGSVTVRIDATSPTITIDDPSLGTGLPLPAAAITGTVGDPLSGPAEVRVTFTNLLTMSEQSRLATITGSIWSVPTAGLPAGPTSVTATATDVADNTSSPTPNVLFLALG